MNSHVLRLTDGSRENDDNQNNWKYALLHVVPFFFNKILQLDEFSIRGKKKSVKERLPGEFVLNRTSRC